MGITAAFMAPHPPLIIPQVGRGQERTIQQTIDAYDAIAKTIGEKKPETVVLISPHQTMYADYFHIAPGMQARGDFGKFGAQDVKLEVRYDVSFVKELCGRVEAARLPAGTEGEIDRRLDHGTMVPLYFVNKYWADYELVSVGLSGLSYQLHYELGKHIQETARSLDKRVVIIASGDLSHRLKADGPYGYAKEGPEYDRRIMTAMGKGDFKELFDFTEDFCKKAGECGHRSFTMMAGALEAEASELGASIYARRLSYEGPFGVGYGICAYEIQ